MRRVCLLGSLLAVACARHEAPPRATSVRATTLTAALHLPRPESFLDWDRGALASVDPVGERGRTLLGARASAATLDLLVDLAPLATVSDASPQAEDDAGACPTGMVLVDGDSCWDVQHTCLLKDTSDPAMRCLEFKVGADVCIPPKKRLRYCMDRYEWPGTPGAKPRVIVSYWEAEAACKSIGKRMCDEQEFYLACEGPEHWPFAWGHVRHPSPCNIDRPYTTVDWAKWAASDKDRLEEAKRLDQALPIGASKCWSPYGIHDIAGNADEWTTAQNGRDLKGSLNGGYWGPVANACRYVTLVHGPEFVFYQIGFRCCSDAKAPAAPATPAAEASPSPS